MGWLKYGFFLLVGGICLAGVMLLALGNSSPFSAVELHRHAKRLNEAAAIQIPHHFLMSEEMRAGNLQLLEKVESGAPLSASQSAAYRVLFQKNLQDSQSFLALFDGQLSVVNNWRMTNDNNLGSTGITGHHDHHDLSARRNYSDVERALENIKKASGPFAFAKRIAAINLANKSLADIISHMGVAPHTVSTAYELPENLWREKAAGTAFEAMMKAYKAAQFVPVNGPQYWQFVGEAVDQYALLVSEVQDSLVENSSWWERRIAGRFLALQTLAPQIDEDIPLRR